MFYEYWGVYENMDLLTISRYKGLKLRWMDYVLSLVSEIKMPLKIFKYIYIHIHIYKGVSVEYRDAFT